MARETVPVVVLVVDGGALVVVVGAAVVVVVGAGLRVVVVVGLAVVVVAGATVVLVVSSALGGTPGEAVVVVELEAEAAVCAVFVSAEPQAAVRVTVANRATASFFTAVSFTRLGGASRLLIDRSALDLDREVLPDR